MRKVLMGAVAVPSILALAACGGGAATEEAAEETTEVAEEAPAETPAAS